MVKAWLLMLGLLCSTAAGAESEWLVDRAHERWIQAVAFSPDGKRLATGSDDQTLKVWDSSSGKLQWEKSAATAITAVAWSADGKHLLSGNWRGGVQVHATGDGEVQTQWQAHQENITGLAVSRDGMVLATASGDDKFKIWDLASRRRLLKIDQENEYNATCAAFSPDGRFVVVGDGEKLLKLYRIQTGELLLTFTGHAESISVVVFRPDGSSRAFQIRSPRMASELQSAAGRNCESRSL